MSIRSSSELPVATCVALKKDHCYGLMAEDDVALTIRRFSLNSVDAMDIPDPNTGQTTSTRNVNFTEAEIEYEYWYVMYGKGFRNPIGHKEYVASKHISYNADDPYDDIMKFCIDQCSMSDLPFFADRIVDAFNHTTVCDSFPSLEQ